jgi:dTDP-4-dehydrorhamnose reductase
VIGDQGQVAWELKRTLAPIGEVLVAGRNSPICLDLSQPKGLRAALHDLRPDWIINAAAYTAVDKAEQEPDLAQAINGESPAALAAFARDAGALLVHYSTDYVFNGTASEPYRETAATHPQSVYGRTKLAGEQAVQSSGADHLILRTSWVYTNRGHNFLRTVRRLAREREELRIVADQHGAPTCARHIAEATAQMLLQMGTQRTAWRDRSGVYHLTAGGETSWHEFACHIVEHQRRHEPVLAKRIEPITTEEYPLPARRPRYSVLNNDKLLDTFGIALPDWKAGLEQVLEELVQGNI